jgi:hypothetical protein
MRKLSLKHRFLAIHKKLTMPSAHFLWINMDIVELWRFGFQDAASVVFEGITELHSSVLYYVLAIVIGVGYALTIARVRFGSRFR